MAVFLLHRRLRGRQVPLSAGGTLRSFLDFHRLHVAHGALMVNARVPLSLGGRPLPLVFDTDAHGEATGARLIDADRSPQEAVFLFKLCHIVGLLVERPRDGDRPPAFLAVESVHRPEDLPAGTEPDTVSWVPTPTRFRQALTRLGHPAPGR